MKRNLSVYIVIIPIIFVLISISLITVFNIYKINENGDRLIVDYKENYLNQQKKLIYDRVHYFSNIVKNRTIKYERENNKFLEKQANKYYQIVSNTYDLNYKKLSKEEMKAFITKKFYSLKTFENSFLDYSLSLIDTKTNKILYSSNQNLLGKSSSLIQEANSKPIFKKSTQRLNSIYETRRFNLDGFTDEISYLKEYRYLDLVVMFSVDKEKFEARTNEKILAELNDLLINSSSYLFIFEIDDLNENLGEFKVLLHQANPDTVGTVLNKDTNNIELNSLRKNIIPKIRDFGEGFLSYDYLMPNQDKISKKMSYFYLNTNKNWVLGTGFYFDDLEKDLKTYQEKIDKQSSESINIALLIAFFATLVISFILFIISSKISNIIKVYSQDLKKSSTELQKQKDVLETLFEKSSDGIVIHDRFGKIINCNDVLLQILGFEEKENLIGKNLLKTSPKNQYDNEKSIKKLNVILASTVEKGFKSFEWLFVKRNKEVIYCDINSTSINLEDKELIYSTVRDITERKELEEKTKNQQLMLAEESKKAAMGEMITMIAHQWRQPLNNVNLLTYFIRDNIENDKISKEQLVEISTDMKTQIEYLSKTIDDFTNFINPRKVLHEFFLEEAIDKTLNIVKGPLEKRDIKVVKNIVNIKIDGIENEFMQVLLNLFNNAKDSLENKEGERFIFINAKKINNKLILTIKDNAGGIPKEILSRIFEPYFTTKHKQNGTGIGLYMSELIIKQYKNGSLIATNEHYYHDTKFYEGAMFTITFELS